MKLFTLGVILLVSLLSAQSALAKNFRCGTELFPSNLRIGVTQYEIAKSCGEPVARKGNRWIYDRRPNERITILVFDEMGRLVAIEKR